MQDREPGRRRACPVDRQSGCVLAEEPVGDPDRPGVVTDQTRQATMLHEGRRCDGRVPDLPARRAGRSSSAPEATGGPLLVPLRGGAVGASELPPGVMGVEVVDAAGDRVRDVRDALEHGRVGVRVVAVPSVLAEVEPVGCDVAAAVRDGACGDTGYVVRVGDPRRIAVLAYGDRWRTITVATPIATPKVPA